MLVEVEAVSAVGVIMGATVVAMMTAEIVEELGDEEAHHHEDQEGRQVIPDLLPEVHILVGVDIEYGDTKATL